MKIRVQISEAYHQEIQHKTGNQPPCGVLRQVILHNVLAGFSWIAFVLQPQEKYTLSTLGDRFRSIRKRVTEYGIGIEEQVHNKETQTITFSPNLEERYCTLYYQKNTNAVNNNAGRLYEELQICL